MFHRQSRYVLPVFLCLLTIVPLLQSSADAATLNVPSQYSTISAAVTAASDGDTILLAPGTYSAGGDLNLDISKSLTFESSDGNASDTIIDCNQNNSFIEELDSNDLSLTFQGLTFQNCEVTVFDLEDSNGSTFTLDNCVLKNISGLDGLDTDEADTVIVSNCTANSNSADVFDVELGSITITNSTFDNDSNIVLYANGSTGMVTNCTFANDGSPSGNGPIGWLNASLTVTDTTFTNNVSNVGGGAITIDSAGLNTPVTLERCLFSGNSAGGYGGGCVLMFEGSHNIPFTAIDCVFLDNSSSTDGAVLAATSPAGAAGSIILTNCSFYGNSYTGGAASGEGTISADSDTPLAVTNCILYGDSTPKEISTANPAESTTITYSDVTGVTNGVDGNIVADPKYANAAGGDLHIDMSSPCVGTGTSVGAPATDYDQYVWGTTVSMGAYSPVGFTVSAPTDAAANASTQFTVTAVAADNVTTITNYAGTIHFTSSDSAATLPSNSTLTDGTQQFDVTFKTLGDQTITATDTSTSAYTGTSGSTLVSGPATHFVVSAPSPITSYTTNSLTVTAEDADNNVAVGYTGTVHLTSTDPGFVNANGNSTLTDGVGSFNFALKTAGTQTITATDTVDSSITGTSADITVDPGPVDGFFVTGASSAAAGSTYHVTVTAHDLFGNTVTAFRDDIHFTSTDPHATLPSDSTLVNGTEQFDVTFKTAGSQTITVTDTSNASLTGTSGDITVTPGAATRLVLTAPSTATAGMTVDLTVTAYDGYGNVATNYAGTMHFTSTDGQAVLPINQPLDNGSETFDVTLKTAGTQTVTATDTVESSITGTSGTIAVNPGAASHFVVTAPSTATAGVAFDLTVTAYDQYGNVTTGYAGDIHFTSSDGQAALPGNSGLVDGAKTFSATLKTAGTQTITATDTTTSSITGTSAAINVSPSSATHLTVTGPSSTTAGSPLSVTVAAIDEFGNVATGYAGTVHFTSTDGAATLPINSGLTNGTKTFSATLKTAGNQRITATDTSNSSITGTSGNIDVSVSAIANLRLSVPSTAAAGTPVSVTVTAIDQYGNPATGFTGMVHFTSTDPSAVLPANSTLSNGTGSFQVTFRTPGNQALEVSDVANTAIIATSAVTVTSTVLHTFASGLQMISAPENYSDLPLSDYLTPAPKAIATWEPSNNRYALSPTSPADAVRPGVGYWADFSASTELLNTGVPTNPSTPVTISLTAGWNMIGDPFGTAVSLSTGVSVTTNDASGLSFAAAAISGIVSPTLYTLSAGSTQYSSGATSLQPYAGYWVYAYMPCTLTISGA